MRGDVRTSRLVNLSNKDIVRFLNSIVSAE